MRTISVPLSDEELALLCRVLDFFKWYHPSSPVEELEFKLREFLEEARS